MEQLISLILAFVMMASVAVGVAPAATEGVVVESIVAEPTPEVPATVWDENEETILLTDGAVYGEGSTSFTFVVSANGQDTTVTVNTDAATVGEALVALDMIAGDDSEWGLYVKTVNGITADYAVDGSYWAFYIDGEYAMTGVDSTEIVAGSTYTFAVEGSDYDYSEDAATFTFVVVYEDGTEESFDISTDAATVGEALVDGGLIEGEDSEWGLYVTTVNGVTVDYAESGHYWAFYIDGEYAMTGVDSTEIVPGSTYTFRVE